jgi:APA family basic amino acid/polyamine antiporter
VLFHWIFSRIDEYQCVSLSDARQFRTVEIKKNVWPAEKRGIQSTFCTVLPILSIAACVVLMLALQAVTWLVFAIVMVISLVIYFGYGYKHS